MFTIVKRQIFDCLKFEEFADNYLRCGNDEEKFIATILKKKRKRRKTSNEKEKSLGNFLFSLNVFINLCSSNFGWLV